jgi:L-arabinose isomerase
MIVSEGEAINEQTLMIGNTSTHVRFPLLPSEYMDKWFIEAPTHHCALAVGHNRSVFEKSAELLKIRYAFI